MFLLYVYSSSCVSELNAYWSYLLLLLLLPFLRIDLQKKIKLYYVFFNSKAILELLITRTMKSVDTEIEKLSSFTYLKPA